MDIMKKSPDILDLLSVGVITGRRNDVWQNQYGEKITGLPSGQIRKDQWKSFLKKNSEVSKRLNRAIKEERIMFTNTEIKKQKSNFSVPVEMRISPSGKNFTMILIEPPDFLESRSKWEEKLRQIEILSVGLSHEIKNPLGSIKGAAQLLKSSISMDKREKYSRIILEEVERIDAIIKELLLFSSRVEPEWKEVNIYEIMEDVISKLGFLILEKKIDLIKDYDPSIEPFISDSELLHRIFYNLLKNAVDASDNGGRIIVTTRIEPEVYLGEKKRRKKILSVQIEDFGKGLSEEEMKRLFTPFFTTKSNGTGLGLVISQNYAHSLGGNIIARRKEDGAIFKLILPV